MVAGSPAVQPALLLTKWSAQLETRSGVRLNVRPASPDDEAQLIDFFRHLAPEDLRFRFLGGDRKLGHEFARELLDVDHIQTENFLVFDAGNNTLVASAMIAAEGESDIAEAAIAVRSDYEARGIGWTLLAYLIDHAARRGARCLQTIESRENLRAIALEREMGFRVSAFPGDATLLLLTKDLFSPTASKRSETR